MSRLVIADIFVVDYYKNQVYAFDSVTKELQATIPVGNIPQGVALNSDGTRAYVTNSSDGTLSVINAETYSVIATVSVGNSPVIPRVSPDDSVVYVPNLTDQTISVISTTTNTVLTQLTRQAVQQQLPLTHKMHSLMLRAHHQTRLK